MVTIMATCITQAPRPHDSPPDNGKHEHVPGGTALVLPPPLVCVHVTEPVEPSALPAYTQGRQAGPVGRSRPGPGVWTSREGVGRPTILDAPHHLPASLPLVGPSG